MVLITFTQADEGLSAIKSANYAELNLDVNYRGLINDEFIPFIMETPSGHIFTEYEYTEDGKLDFVKHFRDATEVLKDLDSYFQNQYDLMRIHKLDSILN